jgi:hypothetical protein
MGCDCAPQVADLFLYWYEHNYVLEGVDVDDPTVHCLKYASRYIDDLNVPNINDEICESIIYDIYPDELDNVPTNSSSFNTTFLDLDISVLVIFHLCYFHVIEYMQLPKIEIVGEDEILDMNDLVANLILL